MTILAHFRDGHVAPVTIRSRFPSEDGHVEVGTATNSQGYMRVLFIRDGVLDPDPTVHKIEVVGPSPLLSVVES